MEQLYIAVQLETRDNTNGYGTPRSHVGTIYFSEGTTANDVITRVMKRQKTQTGVWILQQKVAHPEQHKNLEDGAYITVKDSKHKLQDGTVYVAIYFNGPVFFIDS